MRHSEIVALILDELKTAKIAHPRWPEDPVHAAAIVAEEAGELIQAALDYKYGRSSTTEKMKVEAIQTAAMAFRLLENLEELWP